MLSDPERSSKFLSSSSLPERMQQKDKIVCSFDKKKKEYVVSDFNNLIPIHKQLASQNSEQVEPPRVMMASGSCYYNQ